jgi:flagellar motor switch protein FliM
MTQTTENIPGRAKIQQLLAAIGSNTRDDGAQVEAVDYDWHQPHFFNSQQMKLLAAFAAKVAALIAEKFAALCQKSFEVTIASTSEHFAGQFLGQGQANNTQGPRNYYLPFGLSPEDPCGFASIPPQTAVVWATQLLGDTPPKENQDRSFSDLEMSLLYDMTRSVVEATAAASDKCAFRVTADSVTDSLPIPLKGTEEFCKITFKVKTAGSETASEAHILVLCEKLAPAIADSAQASAKFSAKDITSAIQTHVEKISIPVTVQLACVPVTVEQVLNLAVGDILLLDKKIDEPALLIAAGRTVCRGLCAKSAGNYAIAVTDTFFETT